jgi:hypothetical protein
VILIVFATPGLSPADDPPEVFQKYRDVDISFMYHKFDYKEDLPSPLKSTEDGWLPGFSVAWSRHQKNTVYTRFLTEISSGDVTYDGTTQTGTPIRFTAHNHQFLFRGEFNVGFHFPVSGNLSLTPYTGYGYRFWMRGQAKSTPLYQTYSEEYSWHYWPLGIRADVRLSDRLSVVPNVGIRVMFRGTMTAFLSDLDHRYSNPEFSLGGKTGWFAEIPLKWKVSPSWSFVIKPWYEYSEIGGSDPVAVGYRGSYVGMYYEPSSKTTQYGLNCGMTFTY